jgi:hypothetical protein
MRREAVANAMMYGGGKDNALEIAVELERTEGGTLVVHIEDIGREFDPTQFHRGLRRRRLRRRKSGISEST